VQFPQEAYCVFCGADRHGDLEIPREGLSEWTCETCGSTEVVDHRSGGSWWVVGDRVEWNRNNENEEVQ
jgi:hypothetical protein